MLILTAANHKLQLKLGAAINTDVFAIYWDRGTGASNLMSTYLNTLSATGVTDIVPSPAADITRTVKAMTIRNRHTSQQQTITIVLTNGTLSIELREAVLNPGDTLAYDERTGFSVTPRAQTTNGASQPATNAWTPLVLASPVQCNASANVLTDIPALAIPVVQGGIYRFMFDLLYTANAITTGSRWAITGPAFEMLEYQSEYALTATTKTQNPYLTAYDLPAASSVSSAVATPFANGARIWGKIKASANGNLTPRFASEVAGLGFITAVPGSMSEHMRVV
jgi:hypothetical protein